MEKILAIGCMEGQKKWLIEFAGHLYDIVDVRDDYSAIDYLQDKNHGISLILLYAELLEDKAFNFLSLISILPDLAGIPVIIATENVQKTPLAKLMEHGAYDYVDLTRKPMLILQRIKNILLAMKLHNPKIEAMNTFMFHHCIGAAMFVEVEDKVIRGLMINQEFYDLLGFEKKEFEAFRSNLMDTVLSEEISIITQAIQTAIKEGSSSCIMSNVESNRNFLVRYNRIGNEAEKTVLLATIRDITEFIHSQEANEAMLQIPGNIFYDYDLRKDLIHVYISTRDGVREFNSTGRKIEDSGHTWISPNSYQLFMKKFQEARREPKSGSFEINARLARKSFSWHRLYYRSVSNRSGSIYRIVGRIDNLEFNGWEGLSERPNSICDIETNLLTYQAVVGFINQVLDHKKKGILMLIDINGWKEIREKYDPASYQKFIREIVQKMKENFIPTDIMGKFGEEGFIIFMPETLSSRVAKEKAENIIATISTCLLDWDHQCNIGISIASEHYISANPLLSDANIALWEAKKLGPDQYVIFED